MRTPEELLASALSVIDEAFAFEIEVYSGSRWYRRGRRHVATAVLFSGGHDSTCAVHVASRHPRFDGRVHHIDTGIGSKRTRRHVEDTAKELGWKLQVYRSKETYEKFVRERGFPGPGRHQWIYQRIKERCVREITKAKYIALVTGCRSQESVRRMGHVEAIKWGEKLLNTETGEEVHTCKNRLWVAPCHDWSSEEQAAYMEHFDLPKNPVKIALGMSGECFCGAFASPGEYERVKHHCPDVADEIDRLAKIAKEHGKHCVWGTRPSGQKGVLAVESGPLCSSCDLRARAAGIEFKECK